VSEHLDKHKEVLLRDNPERNESWLGNEHMRKFIGWLQDQISQSDTQISEYLKKLARGPIFTVVTYQVYETNGYTFYTEQRDKKRMYQNCGVRVDGYDVTGQDKNKYYGQIQEIYELDFHGFMIPLFHCNWVDAIKGVVKGKYGFINLDLNYQGCKSESFVLAKHVTQVFYVPDTTNKRLKWLYLENDESLESRMSLMRKNLINLMRFFLMSPRWSSQAYHRPTKLRTCTTATMRKSRISKNQDSNGK
jgi:hypothetical protein